MYRALLHAAQPVLMASSLAACTISPTQRDQSNSQAVAVDTYDAGNVDDCQMRTCVNATNGIHTYDDLEDRAGQISALSEENGNFSEGDENEAINTQICPEDGSGGFYCSGQIGYILMVEQFDESSARREREIKSIGPKWAKVFHRFHPKTKHCALLIVEKGGPAEDFSLNDPFGNEIVEQRCFGFLSSRRVTRKT